MNCTAMSGGVFGNGACTTFYQCVNGAWLPTGAGGPCKCEELTGYTGCGASFVESTTTYEEGVALAKAIRENPSIAQQGGALAESKSGLGTFAIVGGIVAAAVVGSVIVQRRRRGKTGLRGVKTRRAGLKGCRCSC